MLIVLLAACSGSGSSGGSGNTGNTSAITPTIQSGTAIDSTAGVGPTVIQNTVGAGSTGVVTGTGTPQSNTGNPQKQVITLADRTLTIGPVSKSAGSDASSTTISLTLTVTNIGKAPIMNEASFYQLEGAGGDAFGLQSSVSAKFYGAIPPQGSHQGTIVFQVPTAAVSGIHLLYRSEVAGETVLLALNV